MPTLTELLRDAAGDVGVPAPFDELERVARGRRTRRHRRTAGMTVVVCLLVVVAGVTVRSRSTSKQRVATAPSTSVAVSSSVPVSSIPASGPLFSTLTGDVLIFDSGYDGVTLVDIDHRVATRRMGIGQRAGDQPFRIARVGSDLVVGWGNVSAVPIAGGPSRALPPATVFVPAVEPDRVWLVDYPNDAGTPPRAKLVEESTGTMLADVASPFVGGASFGTGIEGGFAMATAHGIDLWHLDTHKVYAHLGGPTGGQGQTFDAVGSLLTWCETPATDPNGPCNSVHLTDLAARGGPKDVLKASYPGKTITAAVISPDGTRIAVSTQDGAVTIEGNGTRQSVVTVQYPSTAWSSDGSRLYVTSNSFETSHTSLDVWSAATGAVEHADLPFGGLLQFVTATEAEVGPRPERTKTPADCPAANGFNEADPHSVCSFGF